MQRSLSIVRKTVRTFPALFVAAFLPLVFAGCFKGNAGVQSWNDFRPAPFIGGGVKEQAGPPKRPITVIAREEGSGTRSAFAELVGVLDADKNDNTVQSAEITNNTAVMMASVAGDKNAIGYISLGSLNGTVKALRIDGVQAGAAEIRSGAYKIARPFIIAVRGGLSNAAQDFVAFMLSPDGQAVVGANGYLPLPQAGQAARGAAGAKVVVAGSSSVTPLMEKLREAYLKKFPGVDIEIQQSDSSTGMNSAISGICDIGMASRELKVSETEKGLTPIVIATDGIAVIVNKDNPLGALTREQVKSIYQGVVTDWGNL
jgi:phosphate transport system substrate-binding protein